MQLGSFSCGGFIWKLGLCGSSACLLIYCWRCLHIYSYKLFILHVEKITFCVANILCFHISLHFLIINSVELSFLIFPCPMHDFISVSETFDWYWSICLLWLQADQQEALKAEFQLSFKQLQERVALYQAQLRKVFISSGSLIEKFFYL